MVSSLVMATRRGREAGLGSVYSLTAMVSGSRRATRLAPNSTTKGAPFESITMP